MSKKEIAILPSERHGAFLSNVLDGMPIDDAAKKAGFSHPRRDAYEILTNPEVQRLVVRYVRGQAETEGIATCLRFLLEVIRKKDAPLKVRVDAAKFVYGHHMPAVKALEGRKEEDKPIEEMTNDELRTFIEAADKQLSHRAKDVTPPSALPQTIEDIM